MASVMEVIYNALPGLIKCRRIQYILGRVNRVKPNIGSGVHKVHKVKKFMAYDAFIISTPRKSMAFSNSRKFLKSNFEARIIPTQGGRFFNNTCNSILHKLP